MQKTLKKTLFLLLAAVIVAATPITAAAQPETPKPDVEPMSISAPAPGGSADSSMETALIAVKSLINIDDKVFTDFNYGSSYSNYETMEGLLWSFYWSSAENASIDATVTAEGELLNYHKYDWNGKSFGFADIDKNAAIGIANAFIKKVNPDTYSYYKAPTNTYADIRSTEYGITYNAEINGYYFNAAQINVSINKFTGEVTGYSTNRINPDKYSFENADGIIEESAAASAYAEKIGLSLEYRSYFDYEKKSLKAFPVYLFNSNSDRFIGAKSGDIVTYVYDLGSDGTYSRHMSTAEAPMPEAAADNSGGSAKSSVSLTPAEISAIEQVAKFITSEQALQKLLDAAELTNLNVGAFAERYIGLNRDYMDNSRYVYDINMYKYDSYNAADDEIMSVYGQVDAVTGRVMSFRFNYSGYPSGNKTAMTEAQAGTAVTAFLKKMAPSEFAKTKLEVIQPTEAIPYTYRGGDYYFNYIRYENNIPFRDNGISVTINENTKKITSYSLNWYNNVSFPGISSVMTPLRALTEYVGQNGSKVDYITVGEGKAALVYNLRSHDYIDPFSGKALDYTGAPWVDSTVMPDYGDVKGHWSEKYVTRLLDNGVFLWSGKFEPEKVMTELEFLQYLMVIDYYNGISRADTQAYFAQRGVKVEASPDKLLTRQEAVRIVVEYLGYGKLAAQSKWFVYPFVDKVDDSYKGYITICHMLGIVKGDTASRFNASSNVTRAHAASMLHNLIIAKS